MGSPGAKGGGAMIGVCRLDTVGGVGCLDIVGGVGSFGGVRARGEGGFVSCREGTCEDALYGGFSASGDDTLGALPQIALSCSPRRVLPLLPDSADRPDTFIERSPERMGSGAGPERGVWWPL